MHCAPSSTSQETSFPDARKLPLPLPRDAPQQCMLVQRRAGVPDGAGGIDGAGGTDGVGGTETAGAVSKAVGMGVHAVLIGNKCIGPMRTL